MGLRQKFWIPQQRWFKWTVFAALWILCFLGLIIIARKDRFYTPDKDLVNYKTELQPLKNEVKDVRFIRKENNKPVYSMQFADLRTENNNLGVFKTALHKIVKIQNLELAFYSYTSPQGASSPTCNNNESSDVISAGSGGVYPTGITNIFSAFRKRPANRYGAGSTGLSAFITPFSRLMTPQDGWRFAVDFSNASEILIDDFAYKTFRDGNLTFSVQSKKLTASFNKPEVILRGHVIIKNSDGSILESNYVKWDIEHRYFTISKGYVLNRNGARTFGKNIRIDDKLNIVRERIGDLGARSNENG